MSGIGDFVSSVKEVQRLAAQVAIELKGDAPGHPFRGNQYEGGGSNGGSGEAQWEKGGSGEYTGYRAATEEGLTNPHEAHGAIYIGSQSQDVEQYARTTPGAKIHKISVDVKKPLDLRNEKDAEALSKIRGTPAWQLQRNGLLSVDRDTKKWLDDNGYDAVINPNESGREGTKPVLVVWNPEKIKKA